MKNNLYKLICLVLAVSIASLGFIASDPSFYILGGLFALIPVAMVVKEKFISPKPKIKLSKKDSSVKNDNENERNLPLVTILFSVTIFSSIGLFFLPSIENNKIGLLKYYLESGSYLEHSWLSLVLISTAFMLGFVKSNKKKSLKVELNLKRGLVSFLSVFFSLIVSLPVILIISTLQITSIGLASTVNPGSISITTNIDQIKEKIKIKNDIPIIIGSDNDARVLMVEHSKISANLSQFYKKNILPAMPHLFYSTIKNPNTAVFLYQDYLVIKTIDKDSIQNISPIISKKIVQKYFDNKYIRDEPVVTVIGRQDYLKYRDDQFNKELEKIQEAIDEIKKQIKFANSKIYEARNAISTLQTYISDNTRYRDDEYNKCVNATYIYYGLYSNYTYRLNSDAYCNSMRSIRDTQNAGYQTSINQYSQNLKYYQSQANILNENFSNLDSYNKLIEQSKSSTPYELGLFEPPNSIKVVLESTSNKAVGDYFATLTHEYLHYTSYVSEDRTLPKFFEEGLTEYLSRSAIKENLKINTNLGYPLITKIIEALFAKTDKDVVYQIYFTKNVDLLAKSLDSVYGKPFYKDTESFFTLIPYLPSDEAIKVANNIMYRIDAQKLSEKDLYSTESVYQ